MRFIGGLIALVVLLVAIAFMAASLVPASSYLGRIEAAASEAIGREVTLGDEIDFTIWPRIGFRVTDLTVANPEGFESDAFVKVEVADLAVDLFALFGGNVAVDRFVLQRPVIALERNAGGEANWELQAAGADEAAEAPDGGADAAKRRGDVRLGDVSVVDGAASFSDAQSNAQYEANQINLTARLASLDEPLETAGEMVFQGAPASFNLVVASLGALIDGAESNVKLDGRLGEANVGADLSVATADDAVTFAGPVSVEAPDLPALAQLFDVELEEAPGFDSLSLAGVADGDADAVRFEDLRLALDAIKATGALTLDISGDKPKAVGALRTESLDLRPYMPPPPADGAGFPAWSDAELNLRSLRNVDAELEFTADEILINQVRTGQSRVNMTIKDGRLTADLPQLQLYEGGGSGRLSVDASGAATRFAGYFDLRAVQAQPFAIDFLKNDRLLGVGALRFEFTARGDSQKAIMSSLDGEGGFDIADGAIKGVNIVKIAQSLKSVVDGGGFSPAALVAAVSSVGQPNDETSFTEFLSAFSIDNGIARAPTISMAGPFFTMTGDGVVDLPRQTIDLNLSPRVTDRTDGGDGLAFSAPLKITGTFNAPKIGVDAEALISDRAAGQGRRLLERALGGEAEGEGEGESEGDPVEDAAKSLLRGLFGAEQDKEGPEKEDRD
ncbi:MAG: AsmA family protein [Pseudomonadota bacterium]